MMPVMETGTGNIRTAPLPLEMMYPAKTQTADCFRNTIVKILGSADIRVNGDRAWDIQINNEAFFRRVYLQGMLGLGESYVEGWWDCRRLDQLFSKICSDQMEGQWPSGGHFIINQVRNAVLYVQSRLRARTNGQSTRAYMAGKDVYEQMLDSRMVTTCAHWSHARNLEEAQEGALDLICRKLHLRPGMRILDLGCGWGSFIKYAAERYRVQCVGVASDRERVEYARRMCRGLSVDIRLQDYKDINEQFDHIVSLGMFEQVGYPNYRSFLAAAHRCLNKEGLFVLQTTGGNQPGASFDPWMDKYISPGSMLPCAAQISAAAEGLFVLEDWQNSGADYDTTLMSWFYNFDRNWPELSAQYGNKFYRTWKYYLLSSAGLFRSRKQQLWRIVLSKNGVVGGYMGD
jgi:cyclopropane-fatty-acyl-phospholipid synthase